MKPVTRIRLADTIRDPMTDAEIDAALDLSLDVDAEVDPFDLEILSPEEIDRREQAIDALPHRRTEGLRRRMAA
jgi:hypothetical protein